MRIKTIRLCLCIIVLFFFSCETLNKIERNNIIYTIPSNAQQVIHKKIQELKKTNKNIYVLFEQTCKGYNIILIPTSSLKQKIQNLNITETRRVLMINDQYYYVIFSTDIYIGGYLESINDKKEGILRKSVKINENTLFMQFDKEWKLIKFQK